MTRKQYIQQLTQAERSIRGKDVPQKASAGEIDDLCDVIVEKESLITDQKAVITSKDDLIARLSQ